MKSTGSGKMGKHATNKQSVTVAPTENKAYQALKKEVISETRKAKTEANSQVLSNFDREEDYEERYVIPMSNTTSGRNKIEDQTLDTILDNIPNISFSSQGYTASKSSDDVNIDSTHWENIFKISMSLYTYKSYLSLPTTTKLSSLVDIIATTSDTMMNCGQLDESNKNGITTTNLSVESTKRRATEITVPSNEGTEMNIDNNTSTQPITEVKVEESSTPAATAINQQNDKSNSMEDDEEAEWDENDEMNKPILSLPPTSITMDDIDSDHDHQHPSHTDVMISSRSTDHHHITTSHTNNLLGMTDSERHRIESIAQLDWIHLKLTKPINEELYQLYEIDTAEPTLPTTTVLSTTAADKKKKIIPIPHFPCNQLTWSELLRMSIIMTIFRETGRTNEEIQYTLRGGKMSPYKTTKAIIRLIRYRMLLRAFHPTIYASHKKRISSIWKKDSYLYNIYVKKCLVTYHNEILSLLLTATSTTSTSSSQQDPLQNDEERASQQIPGDKENREVVTVFCHPWEDKLHMLVMYDAVNIFAPISTNTSATTNTTTSGSSISSTHPQSSYTYDDDEDMNQLHCIEYSTLCSMEIEDIISKVDDITDTGILGRCAKVFIKIATMPNSKDFFLEIDSISSPEYYDTIKRPLTLIHVAHKLITYSYKYISIFHPTNDYSHSVSSSLTTNTVSTATNTHDRSSQPLKVLSEYDISYSFYYDMKQVFLNCITFNTEYSTLVAQAHKLLRIFSRYMHRWVYASDRAPELAQCSDSYCLLTFDIIPYTNDSSTYYSIKCSRCTGIYSLDGINTASGNNPYVIPPTDDQIKHAHEDWYCHFCLLEDSLLLPSSVSDNSIVTVTNHHSSNPSTTTSYDTKVMSNSSNITQHDTRNWSQQIPSITMFEMNEWGPSTQVPWVLNPCYSKLPHSLFQEHPSYELYMQVLNILCDSNLSTLVSPDVDCQSSSSTTLSVGTRTQPRTYNTTERILTLHGLCEIMKTCDSSIEFVNNLNTFAEKLSQLCNKNPFREPDFIDAVERVAGEQGTSLCRVLLDGGNQATTTLDKLDTYQQHHKLITSRCIICRRSTLEHDCPGEEVILCDGCNADAHLKCTNLISIKQHEWHCPACSERLSHREVKPSTKTLENIQDLSFRHKDLEEELIEEAVRIRMGLLNKENDPYFKAECVYCGLNELALCSPLVIGQTRFDHTAHLSMYEQPHIDHFLPHKTHTTVKFYIHGMKQKTPIVEAPYFPPIRTRNGKQLLGIYEKCIHSKESLCIVHEHCAYQMFKARIDPVRHTLRRKLRYITDLIVKLSGLTCESIGTDDSHREYWKLPISSSLLICEKSCQQSYEHTLHDTLQTLLNADNDNENDNDNMIYSNGITHMSALNMTTKTTGVRWKIVSDKVQIQQIVDLLGYSEHETHLKQNIISYVLDERVNRELSDSSISSPLVEEIKVEVGATSGSGSGSSNGVDHSAVETKVSETISHDAMKIDTLESKAVKVQDITENPNGEVSPKSSPALLSDKLKRPQRESAGQKYQTMMNDPTTSSATTALAGVSAESTVPAVAPETITLKLIPEKSVAMPEEFYVKEEVIYLDSRENSNDNPDVEVNIHTEYFDFTRKCYAVALMNNANKRIKPPKGTTTIVYQIHIEGRSDPLSYTPLDEPWSDSIYYFYSLNFKRSGRYTVSFMVEGPMAQEVQPLIYTIVAKAKCIIYGGLAAARQLHAMKYLDARGRQITVSRQTLLDDTLYYQNELESTKSILFLLYAALPFGSLCLNESYTFDNTSFDLMSISAETDCWTDLMDQTWRNAVKGATTPMELMECILLLEYSINRAWMNNHGTRLLSRLPTAHYAIRCCTYSAVALRVFCLDKTIIYDKVHVPPRKSRSSYVDPVLRKDNYSILGDVSADNTSPRGHTKSTTTTATTYSSSSSRAAANKVKSYREVDDEEDENDETNKNNTETSTKSKSNKSQQKKSKAHMEDEDEAEFDDDDEDEEDDDDEDEADDDEEDDAPMYGSRTKRKSSRISSSSNQNKVNNSYDSRKRQRTSNTRSSHSRKRSAYNDDDDDDDTDEGEEYDENGDDDDEEGDYRTTRVKAKSTSHSTQQRHPPKKSNAYREYDDNEDEDEEEEEAPKHTSNTTKSYGKDTITQKNLSPIASIDQEIQRIIRMKDQYQKQPYEYIKNGLKLWCYQILAILRDDFETEIFWEPVDLKAVKGYSKIIRNPMDLGTITNKLRNDAYNQDLMSYFQLEIRLVWYNCTKFNPPQSYLHQTAVRLYRLCDDFFKKLPFPDAQLILKTFDKSQPMISPAVRQGLESLYNQTFSFETKDTATATTTTKGNDEEEEDMAVTESNKDEGHEEEEVEEGDDQEEQREEDQEQEEQEEDEEEWRKESMDQEDEEEEDEEHQEDRNTTNTRNMHMNDLVGDDEYAEQEESHDVAEHDAEQEEEEEHGTLEYANHVHVNDDDDGDDDDDYNSD